jgi:DNA invertase Pin-like site-specific DNA recombinase|tara:strand:- start:992 stop:1783 length:792 start_codon:yes stop_codon:yes gene_type:complete
VSGNPLKQINNIYGYVRVSTDEQVKSGISLETQKQQISEFVREKYNREVTEFFADEGISGTHAVLDRPASRKMTDVIDEHDVVICTRLDRLSRSSSDLLGLIPVLQDIGITLYFCEQFGEMPIVYPDSAKSKGLDAKFDMNSMANQIMLMVLSAVAEIEHATIKDRFAAGKLDWASRGYAIGGSAPYGYRHKEVKTGSKTRQYLEEVPEEQAVLRSIYKLNKRGFGARKIAKQVNSMHNIPPLTHSKVQRILKRKFQGVPDAA